MVYRYCWSFICMLTLFKAIESVKMGLKRVREKKLGGEIELRFKVGSIKFII